MNATLKLKIYFIAFFRTHLKCLSDSVVSASPAQQLQIYEQLKVIRNAVRKKKTQQAVQLFENVVNYIVDDEWDIDIAALFSEGDKPGPSSSSYK